MTSEEGARVQGSVYIELEVSCRRTLSLMLERGWTPEEIQGLADGDDEAREALRVDMITEALLSPDEVDDVIFDIRISEVARA